MCSSISYLIGGGSIAASVCSQIGELLFELVVGAVAEAVDHSGGQQHANDAQDGHNSEDEELGRLCLAVLGGDLVDLASLWATKEQIKRVKNTFQLLFLSDLSGSLCSSIGRAWYSHRQDKSLDSPTMLKMSVLVMVENARE